MCYRIETGGERGIRTPGTFDSTPDLESGTLNRSDISPGMIWFAGSGKYKYAKQIAANIYKQFLFSRFSSPMQLCYPSNCKKCVWGCRSIVFFGSLVDFVLYLFDNVAIKQESRSKS